MEAGDSFVTVDLSLDVLGLCEGLNTAIVPYGSGPVPNKLVMLC